MTSFLYRILLVSIDCWPVRRIIKHQTDQESKLVDEKTNGAYRKYPVGQDSNLWRFNKTDFRYRRSDRLSRKLVQTE